MLRNFFNWTPRDIAYWEKLRKRGLRYFIGWYGILITGGLLFLVFGAITIILWLRQGPILPLSSTSLIFLLGQLIFVALVCLVAGIINSLITWVVEERQYRKYSADNKIENVSGGNK